VNIQGLIPNSSYVLVKIIDKNNTVITEVLNVDKSSFTVRSDFHETVQNIISTYLFLGIEHILIGLLHGFASVLADIGLPGEEKVTALLSFNIGVEIGQLLFVAILLLCFASLKQLIPSFSLSRIRYLVSYGCGTTATYWLLQRLLNF
jgi:hypothetical protein